MDYKALLEKRRAIRDFQDKAVDLSTIREILNESCLAPTASNGQPCKFIIITKKEFMKKLSDESKKNYLDDVLQNPASPLKQYESVLRDESFNAFYNAPCVVYFVGQKKVRSLDVDAALTVAYFMFSATSKGLGTCWVALGANIRDKKILEEMGVPEDCRIVAPVIIGYPKDIPAASERHAPDIVKII
jgi:nitroreductase